MTKTVLLSRGKWFFKKVMEAKHNITAEFVVEGHAFTEDINFIIVNVKTNNSNNYYRIEHNTNVQTPKLLSEFIINNLKENQPEVFL